MTACAAEAGSFGPLVAVATRRPKRQRLNSKATAGNGVNAGPETGFETRCPGCTEKHTNSSNRDLHPRYLASPL